MLNTREINSKSKQESPLTSSRPIGIFGGTFDPIHYGHLRTALELYQTLDLDEIRFTPCQQPVHKAPPQATAAQRLTMLKLAIADQVGLSIDTRELDRQAPSYSVDTLLSLRQELGKQQSLCLIIGSDAYQQLNHWHRWQEIIQLAHIVVISRPGNALATSDIFAQHQVSDSSLLHASAAGAVLFQTVTPLAISSTAIREQITTGKNVRYLLPDKVYNYIQQQEIYSRSHR